jgi:hypothetical protein
MVRVMQELDLHPCIRGRDNLGGTIIGQGSAWYFPKGVDAVLHSFLTVTSLYFGVSETALPLDQGELTKLLVMWCENDDHHLQDPSHCTNLTDSTASHGIMARNLRRVAPSSAADQQ